MKNIAEKIYKEWHEFAKTRQTENLIELYAHNAIFESPLVPIIMKKNNGILNGRDEILEFLIEGTKRRPNELVKWYRTDNYLVNGNTLVWEYPRETPTGNQIDILELMDIENDKIQHHRIYWGWFGTQMLIKSATKK
ncbi:nuclear transport factor 2 family protein [Psychrobacter sp. I-STPA6b]|uniref:nuclear transport factor 2 family protein n=1 Tax=Psychrobacter sp. I-STPA6b TaxID=2585718 RepID=UPI001D0C3821|nr:nuclear transport factor 2 family protein [Psychrobacter sp. I-STPA6b]